jgi:xylulokinase
MFLSPIFRNTLAGVTGATIELFETDGAQGAARAAGVGSGYYKNHSEAFLNLKSLETISPIEKDESAYQEAYSHWKNTLIEKLK